MALDERLAVGREAQRVRRLRQLPRDPLWEAAELAPGRFPRHEGAEPRLGEAQSTGGQGELMGAGWLVLLERRRLKAGGLEGTSTLSPGR